MRWVARSVIPAYSAIARTVISGCCATWMRTTAWFVTKVHPLFRDMSIRNVLLAARQTVTFMSRHELRSCIADSYVTRERAERIGLGEVARTGSAPAFPDSHHAAR